MVSINYKLKNQLKNKRLIEQNQECIHCNKAYFNIVNHRLYTPPQNRHLKLFIYYLFTGPNHL